MHHFMISFINMAKIQKNREVMRNNTKKSDSMIKSDF